MKQTAVTPFQAVWHDRQQPLEIGKHIAGTVLRLKQHPLNLRKISKTKICAVPVTKEVFF
jgi:hypothetical protein